MNGGVYQERIVQMRKPFLLCSAEILQVCQSTHTDHTIHLPDNVGLTLLKGYCENLLGSKLADTVGNADRPARG